MKWSAALAAWCLALAWSSVAWAACSGSSPNLTAASASLTDVAACVTAAASSGDTITVPAGSATWTSALTVTKHIVFTASGTVTLTSNFPGDNSYLFDITESSGGNTKVTGFSFVQGTGPTGTGAFIGVSPGASGKAVLATANIFNVASSGNLIYWKSNQGVIWGNTGTGYYAGPNCLSNGSFVRHKPSGVFTWGTAATFGSADTTGLGALYIEANTVTGLGEGIDSDDNARTVVRYNTFTDSGMTLHGVDTSSVGARYVEYYNNTWIKSPGNTAIQAHCDDPTWDSNWNGVVNVRGGTALIHDNVIPNIDSGVWGAKSEIVFSMENLRRSAGAFPCWDTTTGAGAGYPSPRQSGWGYTTGATTVTGSPGSCPNCPVSQDLEPIYVWNNTGAGNYGSPSVPDYSPNECGGSAPLASTYVQENREYYLSTAKPGYTTYTYPHPLTGLSAAVVPVTSRGAVQWKGNILIR